MLLANQPKFCWPKVLYYAYLGKPVLSKKGYWKSFITTKYLGKAKTLNKKLPVKLRQIDVCSKLANKLYVLEGSYDKRFNYKPRFKFCKTKTNQETSYQS